MKLEGRTEGYRSPRGDYKSESERNEETEKEKGNENENEREEREVEREREERKRKQGVINTGGGLQQLRIEFS